MSKLGFSLSLSSLTGMASQMHPSSCFLSRDRGLRVTNMTPENYSYHDHCNYVYRVYLGQYCHMLMPQCVIKHLRDRHPDPNRKYTGFIPGRTGNGVEIVCALEN